MTAPKPRRNLHPRYISHASLALLHFSFRGKVPAVVVAEALREKAVRERRPLPPSAGGAA